MIIINFYFIYCFLHCYVLSTTNCFVQYTPLTILCQYVRLVFPTLFGYPGVTTRDVA